MSFHDVLAKMTLPQVRVAEELLEAICLPKAPYSADIMQAVHERLTVLETTPARLIVEHDICPESPCEAWDDWKVIDFDNRHRDSYPMGGYLKEIPDGTVAAKHIVFRKRLAVGLAFLLTRTEHGICNWHIAAKGSSARSVDGIMYWQYGPSAIGAKTYKEREDDAERFLETYTSWCNGEVYRYSIQNGEGEQLDGTGLFYGYESLIECLQGEHPELWDTEKAGKPIKAGIKIEGEASHILDL